MSKIKTKILNELRRTATEHIAAMKGNKLKDEDIIIAENLVIFGYLKGLEERDKNQSEPYARRTNLAIISSEWVHNN